MAGTWTKNAALPPPDLVESCRHLQQVIGKCLLQIEAMGVTQGDGCRKVRSELGRLNLMLVREDFRSRETARETCRVVGAQLQETLAIFGECAETVRGAAYLRLSSLIEDWTWLEFCLRHFAARLEEFEDESYSEPVVYTPIPYSHPVPRPRGAAVLSNWLNAIFLHAPARLHRSGAKF